MILKSPPEMEPLTVAKVKTHLRVFDNNEDSLISGMISTARQHVEGFTGRALISQTWQLKCDGFPQFFNVPKAPLISVTAITYLDENGSEQTLAEDQYIVSKPTTAPGKITPAYNVCWPSTYSVADAVTLEFVAGFGDEKSVPDDIKSAMYLYISHLYDNRDGGTMPDVINNMIWRYKVFQ